jgi:hypothetical protein
MFPATFLIELGKERDSMRSNATINAVVLLLVAQLARPADALTYASLEGGQAWQSRNEQRIPGEGSGTTFDLTDFSKGPFSLYRIYVGHRWDTVHELRFLYAPLEVDLEGKFDKVISFMGEDFEPGVETKAFYKFNSYRLTYSYHWTQFADWDLAAGFTGKIRDAEVRITQQRRRKSKTNVGFVPLLNLQASRNICNTWLFRADFDGLAAPQGRAFDIGIFLEHGISTSISGFAGYRTVEGGADNKEVYNFAWFHSAVLGVRGSI